MLITKGPVFQQLADRPLAHCATLTLLPDGSLLTAWYGGAYETAPDVAILAARRGPDEGAWTPPEVIAEAPGHSLGQPVFMVHPNGELWLFFVITTGRTWANAQPYYQRSANWGATWGQAARLLDYPGLMFRSRPLVLPGRIILPVYDENTWQSRMMLSDDNGNTWRLTAPMRTPSGNIQPCPVHLSDGRLLAYLRTGGAGGVIWRSESHDEGETWSLPEPTDIPNPNAGIDLLRLRSGNLALAFNAHNRMRTPLCVALSEAAERWRWRQTLEDERAEFSYPTLLETDDARIHLVYTYKREHIHYACFTESWLRAGKVINHEQPQD